MKYLVLLAARGGATEALTESVRAEGERIATACGGEVTVLRQIAEDPFAAAVPGMRAFDATVEVRNGDASGGGTGRTAGGAGAPGDPADSAVLAALAGLGERLQAWVHPDLSGVLVGEDHVVIPPSAATPVRYQYVMRRRADLTREQYFDHYVNRHAAFGRRTPGIEGYVQFHVQPEPSAKAAEAAGVGMWRADSVSELHLASVETFLSALAEDNPAAEAAEDEERFVDRPNSVMFTSAVVWRA